jgi:hypothetical protein
VHLIYLKGDPAAGDIYYTRREAGKEAFGAPVRVNSQSGSAVAMGTIRGGQIALGKDGRVHVAWNGSRTARPRDPAGAFPMLYARSDPRASSFEPQRNLMQRTTALDGGGTVASDGKGRVYVAWHGRAETDPTGEAWRGVWVACSTDDGTTFATEIPALEKTTGACACCGTRALVDRRGVFYMLYRAATAGVERDICLLTSADHGSRFQEKGLSPWRIGICPMSSASMADTESGVLAAWETNGQVQLARIDPKTMAPSQLIEPPGAGVARKHPALASNKKGEVILVWTEGTGWQKGGALAWRVFDPSLRPTNERGLVEGAIPAWGLATVVAQPDDRFLIIH